MPVQIQNMDSSVEVQEPVDHGPTRAPASASVVQDDDALREALRPIVLQILEEEVLTYRRLRG